MPLHFTVAVRKARSNPGLFHFGLHLPFEDANGIHLGGLRDAQVQIEIDVTTAAVFDPGKHPRPVRDYRPPMPNHTYLLHRAVEYPDIPRGMCIAKVSEAGVATH